jgi:hypothetical protein
VDNAGGHAAPNGVDLQIRVVDVEVYPIQPVRDAHAQDRFAEESDVREVRAAEYAFRPKCAVD